KADAAARCGEIVMRLVAADVRPRAILTRAAFDNAITAVAATAGSTNAVLHLLALAREAGGAVPPDDFEALAARPPALPGPEPGGTLHGRRPRAGRRRAPRRQAPGGGGPPARRGDRERARPARGAGGRRRDAGPAGGAHRRPGPEPERRLRHPARDAGPRRR